jgi:hypothetical protein
VWRDNSETGNKKHVTHMECLVLAGNSAQWKENGVFCWSKNDELESNQLCGEV